MIRQLKKLLGDTSGAAAREYTLIAALVAIAAIVALSAMGYSLKSMFTNNIDSTPSAEESVKMAE